MTTQPITCPADLKEQLRKEALSRLDVVSMQINRQAFDSVFDDFWEKVEQHFAQSIATAGDPKGDPLSMDTASVCCLGDMHAHCTMLDCQCPCHASPTPEREETQRLVWTNHGMEPWTQKDGDTWTKYLTESNHQLARAQDKARIAGLLHLLRLIDFRQPTTFKVLEKMIVAELNRKTGK